MELKNHLRESRAQHGLTQENLADMVGTTRQTIIAIERGGYTPSVALALKLAAALAVPVHDLFWLEER
jgi:putative transcriptional regulator